MGRTAAKTADLIALKALKCSFDPVIIAGMAEDIATLATGLFGATFASIASVACGHSRRPDCLSTRLGQGVALRYGAPFVHRFVSGCFAPEGISQADKLKLPQIEH